MKTLPSTRIIAALLFGGLVALCANADQLSEFDESVVRSTQEARGLPQAVTAAVEAFESSSDPTVKAAKWEDAVVAASEGFVSLDWPTPTGGWKLIDFPAGGNLTVQEVQHQQRNSAYYTKLVAQNEIEAVRLRGAGALLSSAASDGEQWGAKLLLDMAQRPDSNIKRLTYWFALNFGEDKNLIDWQVDWVAWQQAYNAANALGKAIILRNVTMLALRRNEFATAATINLSALSSDDRELKAIALAFGDPALGLAVTTKWSEIANNASDLQLQALAKELRSKHGIKD
jgi:hypothetical protein